MLDRQNEAAVGGSTLAQHIHLRESGSVNIRSATCEVREEQGGSQQDGKNACKTPIIQSFHFMHAGLEMWAEWPQMIELRQIPRVLKS